MAIDPKPTNESTNSASKGIAVSPSASVYEYTILLRFDGAFPEEGDPKEIYLLRFGDRRAGESVIVVEPVGVHRHRGDIKLSVLNTLADLKRRSPADDDHPDDLYAIAEYLTKYSGEIFVVNHPPVKPLPPWIVS